MHLQIPRKAHYCFECSDGASIAVEVRCDSTFSVKNKRLKPAAGKKLIHAHESFFSRLNIASTLHTRLLSIGIIGLLVTSSDHILADIRIAYQQEQTELISKTRSNSNLGT